MYEIKESVNSIKDKKTNWLTLCNNKIGDEGVKAIADALKGNNTIELLSLHNNKIGDEGAKALAGALKGNNTITSLYLDNNQIGNEGVKALADAGHHNFHPTTAGQEIALTGDQDDYPN